MSIKEQQRIVVSRIKAEREKLGYSQLELALRAEISQNMINYIETGKRTPSLDTLLKICQALNISPANLFADSTQERDKAKNTVLSLIQRYFFISM